MPRRDPSRPPSCEDSLRALGRYLDFTGLAEISLVVSADEWALTVRRGHDARQYPARISFTVPEILALRNVTASQRGRGKPGRRRPPSRLRALEERGTSAEPLSAWLEQERALSYQELLRAIGRALDQRDVGSFELHETDTEVIVHLAAAPPAAPELHCLSKQSLRTHLDDAMRQRALHLPEPPAPLRAVTASVAEASGRTTAE
jgi:hypothetical protein